MKLDADQYGRLARLLQEKYNRDFWMDGEAWKGYLESLGIGGMYTNNPQVVVLGDPNNLDGFVTIPDEVALKALALGYFA